MRSCVRTHMLPVACKQGRSVCSALRPTYRASRESERSMLKSGELRRATAIAAALLVALVAVVVLWGARPAEAAFPGINGKIVFESHRESSGGEVYIMNADGSSPTRLTNDPVDADEPALSPDGRKIAFRSQQDGSAEIWVMNADGSGQQQQLTHNTSSVQNGRPTWSHDGTKIAFQTTRDGNSEIYTMNADGSSETNFTNNSNAQDSDPAWSPDGTRIAFVSDPTGGANSEIWVKNVDGSGGQQVTSEPTGHDFHPSWSPSGAQIAFTSNRRTGGEVWVVGSGGGTETYLVSISDGNGAQPAWSPDGTKIAFVSARSPSSNSDIWVMNSDGTGQQLLATAPLDDTQPDWGPLAENTPPTISANLSSITVLEGESVSNSGTYSDADGNTTVTLSASVGEVTQDASGDGTWSWFFTTNDGPEQSQPITITATDDRNASTTTTFDLTVNNGAPTATLNTPESATSGTNFTVSLTNPSDPSSVDTAVGFTYAFDCANDGVFEQTGTSNSVSCTANNGLTQTVRGRITDKDGGSNTYEGAVTLNDTTAPKVTSVMPQEGATGIGPGANVRAAFSEAMRARSINTNTLKLFNTATNTQIDAVVSYEASTKKAVVDPNANLRSGVRYKAVVSSGAKDKAGNSLDQNQNPSDGNQPKVWFFRVRN